MALIKKFAVAHMDLRNSYELTEENGKQVPFLHDTLEAANKSILEDYAESLTVYAESLATSGTSATEVIEDFEQDDLPTIEWCAVTVCLNTDTGELTTEDGQPINLNN